MPFALHDIDDLLVRSVGCLYVDPEGGPVRTIVDGRHTKPTGRYASWKSRRSMPWEAKAELKGFWLAEVDADVVRYLAQPHLLAINVGERRPLYYYPDLRRDHVRGRVSVVEYKGVRDGRAGDPGYLAKLDLARRVYEGMGWTFEVVREDQLDDRTVANALALQTYGDVPVPTHLRLGAVDALREAGGVLPRGRVEEVLGGGLRAEAYLSSLVVARVLAVDVSLRLNRSTPVGLAPFSGEDR